MTKKDIERILIRNGIRADVIEEDNRSFRVITEDVVPVDVKSEIEFLRHPAAKIHYAQKTKDKLEIPITLQKWYKETSKYIK